MGSADLKLIHVRLGYPDREELCLKLWVNLEEEVVRSELSGVGGPEFLALLERWRPQLSGPLNQLPIPQGKKLPEILLREALLKVLGQWNFPVKRKLLCSCRRVKTSVVDWAVTSGAHTPREVTCRTSASTGCGTCQPAVQEIIDYRLSVKKSTS